MSNTIRATASCLAALLALVLAGCSVVPERDPQPAPSTSVPDAVSPSPSGSEAAVPPVSGFPGLECDGLIDPAAVDELIGAGIGSVEEQLADPVIVQDNGIQCTWAESIVVDGFDVSRHAPAIVLRASPHGADYWPGYVSGSGHNQWDDTLGDASGVVCEPGACTLTVLAGEVFMEISAVGNAVGQERAASALRELGATALKQLVGGAEPVEATRPEVRHRTERCLALLGPTGSAELDGSRLAPDRVPRRSMTNSAIDLTGSTVCELVFGDDARIQVLVVPGGGWMASPHDAADGAAPPNEGPTKRIRLDDGSTLQSFTHGRHLVQLRWAGSANDRRAATIAELIVARLG